MLDNFDRWVHHPAKWWQFWLPQSDALGGAIAGIVVGVLIYLLIGG